MLAWALVLITAPLDPVATLRQAEEAFDSAQFENAIPLLRSVLSPPSLPLADTKKARLLLAQALFFSHQTEAARAEILQLLKRAPSTKVDITTSAPAFVEFFNATQARQQKELPPKDEPKKRPVPRPARRADAPLAPASIEATAVPYVGPTAAPPSSAPTLITAPPPPTPSPRAPWYLAMLPFGVGQFANRDVTGGALFLSLETTLLAANIALAVYNGRQNQNGFPHTALYPALYWAQIGTGAAFYATLIMGLIDAFIWSPGRAPHPSLGLTPMPNGALLSFALPSN